MCPRRNASAPASASGAGVGVALVAVVGRGPHPALEAALVELAAEHFLVELADARLGHLVDERELVRDPPLGDPVLEVVAKLLPAQIRALLDYHAGKRPLLPALVGHGYHGGLGDLWVGHDLHLQLH